VSTVKYNLEAHALTQWCTVALTCWCWHVVSQWLHEARSLLCKSDSFSYRLKTVAEVATMW